MKNYCIYRHIRLDKNEVFYIGIGCNKRSHDKSNRSKHWKNIVSKTNYEIQVLKFDLSWKDACELEKILIDYYGRKDLKTGLLINMTDGGEGSVKAVVSKETRLKLSKVHKNKKQSSDHIKKRTNSLIGRKLSSEHKLKLSLAKKGIVSNSSKKIININTNEIYDSITDAARSINMKTTTLCCKLRGQNPNNTNFRYLNHAHS